MNKTIQTKANNPAFIGNSNEFEPMRSKMIEIATVIRTAINDKKRIIIKHHNDTDGFCAGLVLEQAIAPLVSMVAEKRNSLQEKLRRMPSFTPFYNAEDVTKDIAQSLMLSERFSEEPPLVILTDLGSGPENVLGVKLLQAQGSEVIIIDHHPIDETIKAIVPLHLNPLLFETSTTDYCAGILCSELSRFINAKAQPHVYAAVSAIGDRVDEKYSKVYFEGVSESHEKLIEIANAIDFVSFNLRTLEGKEILNALLGTDSNLQDKILPLFSEELNKRNSAIMEQVKKIMTVHKGNSLTITHLPVDDISMRDKYPRLGMIVGMTQDYQKSNIDGPVVTIGTTPNSMTFRAESDGKFDFQKLLEILINEYPQAGIEGGGHPFAGTFRFAEKEYDRIFEKVLSHIKTL